MNQWKKVRVLLALLAVCGLGVGAATVSPATAAHEIVQTITGQDQRQLAAVTSGVHEWPVVGTDPFVDGGVNNANIENVVESQRGRDCAAKLHIPSAVWSAVVTEAKHPGGHVGTMRTNSSFGSMAFGSGCSTENPVIYTGKPVKAFIFSFTYRKTLYTITMPFGCGNISITTAHVNFKTKIKYVVKYVTRVKKVRVEVPVPSKKVVAEQYARSSQGSTSSASATCPAGTISATASSGANAWAHAKAIGNGYAAAQRTAFAVATARTKANTHTTAKCVTKTTPVATPTPSPSITVSPNITVNSCTQNSCTGGSSSASQNTTTNNSTTNNTTTNVTTVNTTTNVTTTTHTTTTQTTTTTPAPQPPSCSNVTTPQDGANGVYANGETYPGKVTVTGKNGDSLTAIFSANLGSFQVGSVTFGSSGVDNPSWTYKAPNDAGDVGKKDQITVRIHDNTTGLDSQPCYSGSFLLSAPPNEGTR